LLSKKLYEKAVQVHDGVGAAMRAATWRSGYLIDTTGLKKEAQEIFIVDYRPASSLDRFMHLSVRMA